VLAVERHYSYPVDVEWVLDRHRREGEPVCIVQARPVTVTTPQTAPTEWNPAASGMSAAGHSLSVRSDHVQFGGKVVDGMIGSMTRLKIAITLPEEQVATARQAVAEGRAASVSAFISQALARRDADEEMAETIAEIYAESGQPTEEDRLWARRVLGLEP